MTVNRFFVSAAIACALHFLAWANPPEELGVPLFTETAPASPNWIENATIYELNVRQFSESGTFTAVEQQLDRIQDLGIDVIWLMPIHPIGAINRKGPLGSYYSVADYRGINPEFGDERSFHSLVDAIHDRGMKVIIDWVANHTAWDHPWTKSNPDFYETDSQGSFVPPHGTDWTDVIQLDFQNKELWKIMKNEMLYWVSVYDIDGFRCDYAAGVPVDFWNDATMALREAKPDVYLLAEAESPELNVESFHSSYAWPMHHVFNSIARGEEPASKILDQLNRQTIYFPHDTHLLNFVTNHDENSWNGTTAERMGPAKRAFEVLMFTLPGVPLIYNGQEAGLSKRLEFFERDPIDWSDLSESAFYKSLTTLKETVPAMRSDAAFQRIPTTADEHIFAFRRTYGQSEVIVIANLTDRPVAFFSASNSLHGIFQSFDSESVVTLSNPASLQLDAWQFKIFTR
ncbi:alpha-amylase family glycosyl hydrolase [Pelagicoccus sp. SDUM812003]|uniref:alpha-amylase family glycosyl hydrolase n=1 Tax=Pelagicoccus sp. SDUM812003 TaxID=3041267 RepID=UPI00280DBF5A|nr:alpha-amylase family glycosyl hydrolase [Pelagicoccus sp. SDUM812003]MDQ8202910.1 alpha-amylase family glycosyl hydrolase [Pelagicoccus sp. SDUM812003]